VTGDRERSPAALAWALAPGTLLAGVAGGIAFPILPIAAERAGLPLLFIGVILATNRAMRVLTSPWIGMLADRIGSRRTLLIGLTVQIAVLLLYALGIATSHVGGFFMAGRLLHGPASACVFIAAQALALHAGGGSNSGGTAGIVRTAMVFGVPAGLALGGLLSDAFGDTAAFLLAASAVLLALTAAFTFVPDLRAPSGPRPSFRAVIQLIRDRRLFAIGALNFILNFSAGGMILTTLALLVHEHHLSAMGRNEQGTAGLLMGLMITIEAATTPLMGRLGDRWRAHARIATLAMIALAGGLVIVALSTHSGGVAAGLCVIGLGVAGLGPSLLVLLGSIIPRERRGSGVGFLQLSGDLGGMLGPLVGTALLATNTTIPYIGTAVLVAGCAPIAAWLAILEMRSHATGGGAGAGGVRPPARSL